MSENISKVALNAKTVGDHVRPESMGTLQTFSDLHSSWTPAAFAKVWVDQAQSDTKRALEAIFVTVERMKSVLASADNRQGEMTVRAGPQGSIMGEVAYRIESATKYEVLYKSLTAEMPDDHFHFAIDGDRYILTGNRVTATTINRMDITFTDADNWTILSESYRDPLPVESSMKVMRMYQERRQGIWYGKVQVYVPFDLQFHLTEFVGDAQGTTASKYRWVPESLTSYDTIADYEYSGIDGGSDGPANPICFRDGQEPTTLAACASSNPDVSAPNYLPNERWLLPSEMVTFQLTMPTKSTMEK
jgi:hypothetical protein